MAQHQGRKRKGDSAHDHLAKDDVPTLNIKLPKKSDLPNTSKPWNDVQLPVDILLMTVEDCEFLACYANLKNSFKSYHPIVGYVYFGNMGQNGDVPLKVALMTCSEDSSAPGGSLVTVKNAVVELRPKAVFYVGCCEAVTKLQLGDVVVSSKLTTEAFKTPVGRGIMQLVKHADDGWTPPLRGPDVHEVQVCCDGEIISGTDPISAKRQCMSDSTKAVAFERGGGGLFTAAHDLKIEWVIVKGISHFFNDGSAPNESWKSFASIMAASLVSNMLNDPVVFKEWPHYEDLSMKKQPASEPKKKFPDSVCLEKCQKRLKMVYKAKSKVRIIPWDPSSAVDIDEMYTQLTWLKDHRKPSGVTQNKLGSYTEIFNSGKRLLVYGRPGIGKTVFTKKAAFDWSQLRYQETIGAFELVLLIRLRDVCNLHDVSSIFKASQLLANDGKISVGDLYDYALNHQEKVLLILDGYDEYSAGEQSPVDEIWERNQLSDCCVIITSRLMTTDKLRLPSDAQFEIKGFDDERQKKFARRFLKDKDDVRKFRDYLREQDLKDLAEIPLLLLILCLLWKKKDRKELPKKRVEIFTQFVETLFHHMREKHSAESVFNYEDCSDELYELGRLAFEALMNDNLYFPRSELPNYDLIERLIKVGLFQVLNMSSLNPEKGGYFIHKSLQEYLAASFLKEELVLSKKNESTNSLSKLDSVEKILKMNEVFKFACELSEEAAREIVIHLIKMAANEEGLTKYTFDSKAPSAKEFSEDQRNFLRLSTELFFYCSAETKRNRFPTFLSSFRGVLLIEADQLNDLVKEKLVKTTVNVNYVFFTCSEKYTEQHYKNLTVLSEQLNAVIVSCSGEQKASEFLSNFRWCKVHEFFLKKEENNTHLYFTLISTDGSGFVARDIIKALISKQETTKKTNMNGDESSEESSSSSCCLKRHGLSRVWKIHAWGLNRSKVEQLIEIMPFITAPHWIWVVGERGEVYDAEVTESLLRSIPTTHKMEDLSLRGINVTSSLAVEFIDSVFKKAPNLKWLDMSDNPLPGAGVDSLIKHLSCAPHLEELDLEGVKMTPQQVKDLSSAIKQHGNITNLGSEYHEPNGDPKPEHKWPSEDFWKRWYPRFFTDSSSGLGDDQEQILAETHPSVHAPFVAHDPDTVGTFPVLPHPAGGLVLAGALTPAVHGSSHGLSCFSGYPPPRVDSQLHFSPDNHTHHHNTPSTICTPGRSWRYPYLSGSGLSTVTQGESHLECLFVNETASALQRNTRPSTHDSPLPVYGQETVRAVPLPHHRAGEVPISVAHGFSHDTALFGVSCPQPFYPLHFSSPYSSTHHRSGPSAVVTPERSLSSGPYPGGSGMSTVTHPPEMQEFSSPHGTLTRPLHGLQPQTTIPWASNFSGLGVSTITHPPRPLLHGLQHHSTIPDVPNLGGFGLSSDTLPLQTPELRASYGTPSPSLHELQPHHTFPDASYLSGFGLSTVTHLPGISGRSSTFGTIRPPQYELQLQSVIPGDPHLSDPATSSVTHPSVIRFPSDRPRHETHSQNVIPGVSYLGGPGEKVETRTVSKKTLPTSIRQLPEKKDYQVKEGIPSDEDLERLSVKVEKWKPLARRLKLEAAELEALHKDNEEWSEKAFAMLIKWKRKKGSKATYRCLYDALCHDLVNRRDLAEEFCCSYSKPEG